ncbi:MAG TPA: sigma-70 family RNA polymerase sigma factor [Thermoleophilaceae bacterium]|nr:sigma-70 family RNA polymerase sigma factor [Thermoleophilaceae bacterium]
MTPQALQKVSSTTWDWEELRSFAYSQALHVVGNSDSADEAAQEAIVRAWRHRDSCRRPDQPFGWLRRIAHHEAVRVATRRPKEVLVDEPAVAQIGRRDEQEVLEDRLLFSGILDTLSSADQELAYLRYYEDLTCAKLAEHFGLSEATVKVRLHRLRRRLKQRLEDQT